MNFYNDESAAADSTSNYMFHHSHTSACEQSTLYRCCCKCLGEKGFLFWWANNWYHLGCLPSRENKLLLNDLRLPRGSYTRRVPPTVATLNYKPHYHRSCNPSIRGI